MLKVYKTVPQNSQSIPTRNRTAYNKYFVLANLADVLDSPRCYGVKFSLPNGSYVLIDKCNIEPAGLSVKDVDALNSLIGVTHSAHAKGFRVFMWGRDE